MSPFFSVINDDSINNSAITVDAAKNIWELTNRFIKSVEYFKSVVEKLESDEGPVEIYEFWDQCEEVSEGGSWSPPWERFNELAEGLRERIFSAMKSERRCVRIGGMVLEAIDKTYFTGAENGESLSDRNKLRGLVTEWVNSTTMTFIEQPVDLDVDEIKELWLNNGSIQCGETEEYDDESFNDEDGKFFGDGYKYLYEVIDQNWDHIKLWLEKNTIVDIGSDEESSHRAAWFDLDVPDY